MTPFFRKLQESEGQSEPILKPGRPDHESVQSPVNQEIRVGDVRATFGQVDRDDQIHRLRFMRETAKLSEEQEDEWDDRQSPLNFVILASLMIVLVVLGWFGYRWFSQSYNDTPPVLMADESPYKMRPENPGGMVIPHQDKLIYSRITPQNQGMPERLLPPTEQPIIPESNPVYPAPQYYGAPVQQGEYYPPQQQGMVAGGAPQLPEQYAPPPQIRHDQQGQPQYYQQDVYNQRQPQSNYPQHQQPQPQYYQQGGNPQVMPPASQQYYGQQPAPLPQQLTQDQYLAQGPIARVEKATAQESQVSSADPLDELVSSEVKAVEKTGTTKLKLASLNNDSPFSTVKGTKPSVKKTPAKAPVVQGDYRVQIGSFLSEKESKREIQRLRSLDGSLFSGRKFIIQKSSSSVTGDTVYKVMIGFFPSAATANNFKNKMKIHRVNGIVVKTA